MIAMSQPFDQVFLQKVDGRKIWSIINLLLGRLFGQSF